MAASVWDTERETSSRVTHRLQFEERRVARSGEPNMDQELFARFRKCAVDVLSVDADKVVPEASFGDDLEADSLDLVELVMALEEEFGVEVPEKEVEDIKTVGQAFDLIIGKLG